MKPNHETRTLEGSLPVKGRRMDIDPDAMAHILRILIDLYKDKELAVIRELATNAIDSHIMAGVTKPIEVFTPGPLAPYLVIKDYGLGLTVDEIYALFGRYGASTKRGTNDATGMLGLGSKSPLTYTDQFTMTAVKDGVRAVVAITRDEDGVGQLTVVDTATTSDGNGVEIKIPAKMGNTFQKKAKEMFRFWRTGTVLLDEQDPSGLGDQVIKITNDIFLHQTQDRYASTGRSVIVMGNVPYPAPQLDPQLLGLPYGHFVTAYVAIGEVDFTPSREGLSETKRTLAAIEKIKKDFKAGLADAVQKEAGAAPTPAAAIAVVQKWRGIYGSRVATMPTFHYKGTPIPMEIRVPKDPYSTGFKQKMLLTYRSEITSRSRSAVQSTSSIAIDQMLNALYITDFDKNGVSPTLRRKAGQWHNKSGLPGVQYYVWLDWKPDALKFIDPKFIVDFATIQAEVLPKIVNGTSGRIPGSYDLVYGGSANAAHGKYGYGVPGDKIDQSFPVFHAHGNPQEVMFRYVKILDHFYNRYTVVCLPENRLAKFRREQPKIQDARDHVKELAAKASKSMTQDQKDALTQKDEGDRGTWELFQGHEKVLKDPAIKRAIKLSKVKIEGLEKSRERFRGKLDFPRGVWNNPLDAYPLVAHLYGRTLQQFMDAAVRYLNFEYDYKQKGQP